MEDIVITVFGITGLLALVSLLLPVAKRFNFPYTVLLAAVGTVLGVVVVALREREGLGPLGDFFAALDSFEITAEAVLFVFLPTLIFESALSINVRRLMDDIAPILLLAVVGLLISTFVVGYTLWAVSGFALVVCLLLGAIVSATDPVAVVALFRDLGAPKRLAILVEGESLFNDATAIVLFSILAAMLLGGREANLVAGAGAFVLVFVGGALVGCLCALAMCAVIGRLRDLPLVEITLTVCLAYLVFVLAEHYLGVSGVMAVVTAALVVGSYGRTKISPSTWHGLVETWEQLSFWANSLIFVLVGLAVPHLLLEVGARQVGLLAVLIVVAFGARAAILYSFLPALSRLGFAERVSGAYTTVMLWGGLRGAVSLALALAVLETPGFAPEVKSFVVILVTGFVLFTLFVNAPTMRPLLRLFGLDKLPPAELAIRNRVMALSLSNIRKDIDRVAEDYRVEPALVREIAGGYEQRLAAVETSMERVEGLSYGDRVRIGLGTLVSHERQLYLKHFTGGVISPDITRLLLAQADEILDGVKTGGVAGFEAAVERTLGYPLAFRASLYAQRLLGLTGPLARRLADRFEVLLATESVLRELLVYSREIIGSLLGEAAREDVERLLTARLGETEKVLGALNLQYPEYADALKTRLLGRVALRLEDADYRRMLDEAVVSREVFDDLESDLRARAGVLDRRPVLDLGLEPEKLVAKVPFFADLPPRRIAEIARLLKPRLVLPGETVVRKGEAGDAMYFISTGAVEVDLEPEPVRLGSGDLFGEIALLKDIQRTADVTALGYCRLLALYVKDFRSLLDSDPALSETITRVAEERLAAGD